MTYSPVQINDIQRASKTTSEHELKRLQSAAEERGWTGGDIASAAGIKNFNSKKDLTQAITYLNEWGAKKQATPAMEEARARAQQAQDTAYTDKEMPKTVIDGTAGEAIKQVSQSANEFGAYNPRYSFAMKTIGDMQSRNNDQQIAGFSRSIPAPPTPEEGIAKAATAASDLASKYRSMFG
jgi:hypothetical protein